MIEGNIVADFPTSKSERSTAGQSISPRSGGRGSTFLQEKISFFASSTAFPISEILAYDLTDESDRHNAHGSKRCLGSTLQFCEVQSVT